MKTTLILLTLIFFNCSTVFSQNVAINSDGSIPNADAILHLKSTNKGLLIPTMNTSQRNIISNISDGILVYDTQTNSFWFRDAGIWHELLSDTYAPTLPSELKDNDNDTKIQVEETNDDDQIRFDIKGNEQLVIKENPHGVLLMEPVGNNNAYNTAFGFGAGINTDPSIFPNGGWNTYFGNTAGNANQTGVYNTYIGRRAGSNNQTGNYNTNIGANAGEGFENGNSNTMLGYSTGYLQASGINNVYIGSSAGSRKTAGSGNVLIGYEAGKLSETSSGNIMIGNQAGLSESGSNKLYIDNTSTSSPLIYGDFSSNELLVSGNLIANKPSSSNSDGQLFLSVDGSKKYSFGYNTSRNHFAIKNEITNDNVFYIEGGKVSIQRNNPTNAFEVNGTVSKSSAGDWLANSDARLKKNITALDEDMVLKKLLQLQGVTYEWNDHRPDYKRPVGVQYGFTAQNIQQVFPELVSEDNEGYLQTAYGTYDAMYIEAIRALVQQIDTLKNQVNTLHGQVNDLQAKIIK